jgi:carboxymethylenebutenolidase
MHRRHLVALSAALLFTALTAGGQEHQHGSATATVTTSTPVAHAGKTITFASTPGKGSGYLSLPKEKGKRPAIIVIQEWWGLNDWIKEQADRFAAQGYVALAPDLYRGQVAAEPGLAHELSRGLPEDRAINDLKGAFNELVTRRDVDPNRIGVIGWCMGGGWALQLAIKEPRLKAAVINYGRLVSDPATVANIHPSVMGNFGANDRGIPVADVKTFETTLKQTGGEPDIKIYQGAGHGFMNPNNKDGYAPEAAADAQARIDAFLAKRLGR